jgi:hypothetical protein
MQPIIAAATSCRLFDLPRKRPHQKAPTPPARPNRPYLQRRRGRTEVALTRPGVREDADFWWDAVDRERKRPIFTVPLHLLDSAALFSSGDGPVFATLKYDLPSSAIQFAKSQVAAGDALCLLPIVHGAGIHVQAIELTVFAAPDVAAALARAALEHSINADQADELDEYGVDDSGFPRLVHAAMMLKYDLNIVGIGGGDPERRLQSLLRGVADQGDWNSIQKALAAGEAIATIERRPVERHAAWTADNLDAANTLEQWAAEQDLLSAETVELAQTTVASITPEQATDPTILTVERRSSMAGHWRRWLTDLARRLDAAVRSRRVRALSANALPPVLTRKTLDQLASPERWKDFNFYALREDTQALLDFVRERTGAHVYTTMSNGDIQERASSWDCRQALSEAFDGHFDGRHIVDFREKQSGIKFQIWWPGVSPPPIVRERSPADDAEQEEMMRELMVDPPPKADRPLEVVGWGIADFLFRGASVEPATRAGIETEDRLLLRSVFEYPTGTELRRPRYRSDGPWSEVDWKALRRRIRQVRAHIMGPLSRGTAPAPGREPVLQHAAARRMEGWAFADRLGFRISPRDRR